MKKLLILSAVIIFSAFKVSAQRLVPAKDAVKHIGEKVTICDMVAGEDVKAFVIVLFIGGDRPDELLTVTCRATGKNKSNVSFDTPYKGREICVTGVIVKGRDGQPTIKVTDPGQIKPFMIDNPVKEKSSLN